MMGDGDEEQTSPRLFLCFECPLVGLLSLLLAPCPVLLPSSGAVRSSLPALLAVYHGVGRDGTRSLSRYRLPALPPFACSVGGSICVGNVMRELYI